MRAIAGVASRIGEQFVPLEGAPETLGQGRAKGMMNLGKGINDLGQAQAEIERSLAEIRNRSELHQAELAMEQKAGEFEKWRMSNMNSPDLWEEEWNRHMSDFSSQYLKGKTLAPAAQRAIEMKASSFAQERATMIGVDRVRRTVTMGGEALRAEYLRAVEAGDPNGMAMSAKAGFDLGLWGEDDAARMEISGRDHINQKLLETGLNRANTFLNYGDINSAIETINSIPGLPDDERELHISKIKTQNAVQVETEDVLEMASTTGPKAALAALQDEKNYPHLQGLKRAEVRSELWKAHYGQRDAIIGGIKEGIENGNVSNLLQIASAMEGYDLTANETATFMKLLSGEKIKDYSFIQNAVTTAGNYDPASDPDGLKALAFASEVKAVIGEDPIADSILGTLEKRKAGVPLSMPEMVLSQKTEQYKSIIDAKGSWKIPSKRIVIVKDEETGLETFVDTGADIKPGDPGYFEQKRGTAMTVVGTVTQAASFGMFGSPIKGRAVRLTQDDKDVVRKRIESGKDSGIMVEDLETKNKELGHGTQIVAQVVEKAKNGETDPAKLDQMFNELILPESDAAAQQIMSPAIFPATLQAISEQATSTEDRNRLIDEARAKAEANRKAQQKPAQ